jgi:GWxTD domain-containing protein
MQVKICAGIFCIILITIFSVGCSTLSVEKTAVTYKQHVQNDMYIILTSDEYSELGNCTTDNEINIFLDNFWKAKGNELKNEYMKRVEYANLHYPDRYGWGRSDRKRIYITYGPPIDIDKTNFADISIGQVAKVKSIEIWHYWRPGKNNSFRTQFADVSIGEMKFVFADMIGSGVYEIIDSSEDPGDIDSRIFKKF